MYDIVKDVDLIRSICSSIHSVRKHLNIPTSQPLQRAVFYKGEEFDWLIHSLYRKDVEDECQIKSFEWDYILDTDYTDFGIATEARLNFREAGKLLGKDTQRIAKLVTAGDYSIPSGADDVSVGGLTIPAHLVEVRTSIDNEKNQKRGYYAFKVGNESFITIDTLIYPQLYFEKLAKEITKLINAQRREEGYHISDVVEVHLNLGGDYVDALSNNKAKIEKDAKCVVRSFTLDIGNTLEYRQMMKV